MPARADLHLHTWYSDGVESPRRVVELAARAGMDLIAITDHDSMGALAEAEEAGIKRGVKVIPAAEFTAVLHGMEVHLLGYFPAEPGEPVRSHLGRMQEFRRQRIECAVVKLRERGYGITVEGLPAADCCESLTSAHLARMLLAEGFARSFRTVFRRRAVRDALGGFETGAGEVIEVIHAGGGLAVWAHPPERRFNRRLRELAALGLDGVEAYNFRRDGANREGMRAAALELGLVATGGSDWHEGPGLGEQCVEGPVLEAFLKRLGTGD